MENVIDLKMKLFAGDPICVKGIGEIKPLTLKEIKKLGYLRYNQLLYVLTNTVEDKATRLIVSMGRNKKIYFYDLILQKFDDNLEKMFFEALSVFIGGNNWQVDKTGEVIIFKDRNNKISGINKDNYLELIDVLSYQNCLKSINETLKSQYNPANDQANAIIEKIKKGKEDAKKYKNESSKGDNDIDIIDVMSGVSAKSYSVSKFNIWDLTVYQLYDEFNGLKAIDNYQINIQSMLAGASNVQLKHWVDKSSE